MTCCASSSESPDDTLYRFANRSGDPLREGEHRIGKPQAGNVTRPRLLPRPALAPLGRVSFAPRTGVIPSRIGAAVLAVLCLVMGHLSPSFAVVCTLEFWMPLFVLHLSVRHRFSCT